VGNLPGQHYNFRYLAAEVGLTGLEGSRAHGEPEVKTPKILAVASAVELDFRYGCTPAWWQLWKGIHEAGVELVVTPYRGRAIQSPWWRSYDNPCRREGEAFAAVRAALARLRGDQLLRRPEEEPADTVGDRFARNLIWRWVTPRWRAHLARILERERFDAVVVFTVPMSHLRGIPTYLRERFDVPVVYYDGDVPMSLPEYGGMDTGFNIYRGADPAEYDLVLSNSEGGLARLRELGARRAESLFWAVDPELFSPLPEPKEVDVFFYGYGSKFRRESMQELLAEPSRRLPDVDFAIGGGDFREPIGRARKLGWIPFNDFRRAIAASHINVSITRRPHAMINGSSTARLFELASSGAAIVSGPQEGIERWFEPGHELLVAASADEAVDAYRTLLDDPALAEELGRRARERVLDEHTYVHRARRLLALTGIAGTAVEAAATGV
jgi:glycosyltransferase involved in cell wall biosynthesis